MSKRPTVSVLIPARNEQADIAATVRAAASLGAAEVIVADDASTDSTAEEARRAGARVISLKRRAGKGGALRSAIAQARGGIVVLLDADVGSSAAQARLLVEPVASGKAGMAIAVFPPGPRAGFGVARGIAYWAIRLLGWRRMRAPLSGQRAILRSLLDRLNIANRFGVEVALTLDAMALGARIVEVPAGMTHRRTRRDLPGFVHRARQAADALSVFIPRLLWPVGPAGQLAGRPRMVAWLIISALWLAACFLAGQAAFAWGLLVLWSFVLLLVWIWCVNAMNLRKPNYRGRSLPASVGFAFIPTMLFGWWLLRGWYAPGAVLGLALAAVGMLDDAFGSRERGFAGHFGALFRGRLTTGALKAVVGGGTCVAVGLWINGWRPWPGIVDGVLIALCANALNLLDLRPGRALKGFASLAAISLAVNPRGAVLLAPLLIAAAVYAPLDLYEQAMMGDAGSNALGGIAGLWLAAALPLWGRGALLAILAGLHLFCERRSLSEAIERIRPLRWLDNLARPYLMT